MTLEELELKAETAVSLVLSTRESGYFQIKEINRLLWQKGKFWEKIMIATGLMGQSMVVARLREDLMQKPEVLEQLEMDIMENRRKVGEVMHDFAVSERNPWFDEICTMHAQKIVDDWSKMPEIKAHQVTSTLINLKEHLETNTGDFKQYFANISKRIAPHISGLIETEMSCRKPDCIYELAKYLKLLNLIQNTTSIASSSNKLVIGDDNSIISPQMLSKYSELIYEALLHLLTTIISAHQSNPFPALTQPENSMLSLLKTYQPVLEENKGSYHSLTALEICMEHCLTLFCKKSFGITAEKARELLENKNKHFLKLYFENIHKPSWQGDLTSLKLTAKAAVYQLSLLCTIDDLIRGLST